MKDHDKKFDYLRDLLDAIVDDCNMEGTIQHVNVLDTIDLLQKEVNRTLLVERESNET